MRCAIVVLFVVAAFSIGKSLSPLVHKSLTRWSMYR